jgi:hypothetical protein
MRRLSAVRPARAFEESLFFLPYLTLGLVSLVSALSGVAVGNGFGAAGAGGVGGGGAGGLTVGCLSLLPKIHISFYRVD